MFHHSPICPTSSSKQNGFTLVELSVVLVLIALITGGVLAGIEVKHSAELKSIATEVQGFRSAVEQFKDSYDGLPGDITNATTQWGAAHATPATCQTTVSTNQATCDGDGNGWITTAGDGTTYYEAHRFWQQLANAKLIEGFYHGARTGSGTDVTCQTSNHCPASDFKNGMYFAATLNTTSTYFNATGMGGALNTFTGDLGNSIVLFKNTSAAGTTGAFVGAPLLTTEEAYNIDKKFDDGLPAKGIIQTFEPAAGASYLTNSCASSATENSATYSVTTTGLQCALIFANAF